MFRASTCIFGLSLVGLGLAASLHAQGNEQIFFNATRFGETTATRATTGSVDRIFFTQPVDFRRGTGNATGWRLVLQDQDPRTREAIRLSYHNLDFGSSVPIKTELIGANFIAFGGSSSGAKAFLYSFTTAVSFPVPDFSAIGIELPLPVSWPADACTIHCQRGDRTRVSTPRRQSFTFKLQGSNVVPEWRDGTSFRFGGLYEAPVIQAFNASNAYSSTGSDDLHGPESLAWESGGTRVDSLGLRVDAGLPYRTRGDQLGVAAIFLSASYRLPPIPLPPFGNYLIDENTTQFLAYMILDGQGKRRAVTVPVPANLTISVAWQSFFVAIDTNLSRITSFGLSNAVRTRFR